jgi:hypothetical protein
VVPGGTVAVSGATTGKAEAGAFCFFLNPMFWQQQHQQHKAIVAMIPMARTTKTAIDNEKACLTVPFVMALGGMTIEPVDPPMHTLEFGGQQA